MKTKFLGLLTVLFLLSACTGAPIVAPAPSAQPPTAPPAASAAPVAAAMPAATPTSAPIDTPMPASPTNAPTASVVVATQTAVPPVTQAPKSLVEYGVTSKDIVKAGIAALRRDVPLLVAAGIIPRAALRGSGPDLLEGIEVPTTQDPAAACGGAQMPHPTLVADAALMRDLQKQLSAIKPPDEAADWVHKPLLNAVKQWANALDKTNASCATANTAERKRLRVEAGLELGEAFVNFTVATVAATQIFAWTTLLDAAEAVSGEKVLGEDASADQPCAEPDIYHANAQLAGAALASADLSNCILTNANLRGADLSSAMLDNANLVGADLRDAILTNAILGGANLTGARLNGADLRNTIWDDAILAGADLSDADLRSALLSGADLDGVIWNNTVCPDGTNSDTNGLNACPAE